MRVRDYYCLARPRRQTIVRMQVGSRQAVEYALRGFHRQGAGLNYLAFMRVNPGRPRGRPRKHCRVDNNVLRVHYRVIETRMPQ